MEVDFVLNGTTPILFHADDVMEADGLDEWRKSPDNKSISKAGDDRSPAWTWQTYLYHGSDGMVAWPAANFMVGLRQAGAQVVMKKQKTFKEATQSGIRVTSGEYLTFRSAGKPVKMADLAAIRDLSFKEQFERVKKLGFVLFVKRARVGQSKHVRVRARFDAPWSIAGTLDVCEPAITFEVLKQIMEIAGRGGQGDWRPACRTPGPFGMFTATLKQK